MLNYSSHQVRAGGFLPGTPVTSDPPVPGTVFQWKNEILGPGAARYKIMTQGPATVPSGIAAVGEGGGGTFNYKLMTKPNPKILSSEGWGVLQGPEYISARIDWCLTRAARAAIFSFSKCATA